MKYLGRYLAVLAVLFVVAGCNGGGGNAGSSFSSGLDTVPVFSPGDNGTDPGDNTDPGDDPTGDGETIAKIHNPEPASMLLWGIGLAGAALSRRKKKMKALALILGILILCSATPAFASFTNGGFEDGSFNGWTKDGGTNGGRGFGSSYPPQGLTFTGDPGKSAIVSPGLDPYTNNNLNMVYNGNNSARVNNYDNDWHISSISQTVTWNDPMIYFAWAAVLEDPGHPSNLPTWDEQPFFHLTLEDVTTNSVLYDMFFDATTMQSNPNIVGGVKNGSYGWLYTDWQNIGLDTSAVMGDTLKLTLLASDCGQGGHGGYAYLDGFAPTIIPQGGVVPEPASMVLMGIGLAATLRKRFAKR